MTPIAYIRTITVRGGTPTSVRATFYDDVLTDLAVGQLIAAGIPRRDILVEAIPSLGNVFDILELVKNNYHLRKQEVKPTAD